MPRLSKIGAAALAAFGWTSGAPAVNASYLVVAGGGGGGAGIGGGGGAGGLLTGTTSLNPTLSYTVTVGAAGARAASNIVAGNQGSNSVFNAVTSIGGGGGGAGQSAVAPTSGGSGGGGTASANAGGTGTAGQGNNGGTGINSGSNGSGGGGGASAVGGNGTSTTGGNGGAGTASSITGTSVTYAGGGGGGIFSTGSSAGSGGAGGGGAGTTSDTGATSGTASTGGGGGGGGYSSSGGAGGNGGSGVVIISYPAPQQFGGGVVTASGGNIIHTFNTSGTLSPLSSLTASYLIVAGGGAGALNRGAGGGGGGGMLTGSGVTIDTNSTYLVTVGAGGVGTSTSVATNGSNSLFSAVSTAAVGGGAGGSSNQPSYNGANGGSGGGAGSAVNTGGTGGSATSGQGNAGGNVTGAGSTTNQEAGAGGGGAGAVGSSTSTAQTGANGGAGLASSISGSSVTYAGGGGGSANGASSVAGSGGSGGGGNGKATSTGNGDAGSGTANLGGGGGGHPSGQTPPITGSSGSGGSGIVIISYPGAVQSMAGGTVTISGGNVIHTFTSSGYLTPLKLVNNSLRFRSSASAYLNRTPSTASNRKTWTWSAWVKRGTLSVANRLFAADDGSASTDQDYNTLLFNSSNQLQFSGNLTDFRITTAVYRDPAAWYHIVFAVDTTQATAANRFKLYVNGVEVTAFGTSNNPAQNTDLAVNAAIGHYIGAIATSPSGYFDGYMTEVNLIDGQALTPNSFGTFNSFGVWQPITYGGSYGTNGFYLPFPNNNGSTYAGSFNGSNQYLSVAQNSAFSFGTGDFTIETWVFANSWNSVNPIIVLGDGAVGGPFVYSGWVVRYDSSGGLIFYRYDGTETSLNSGALLNAGQWNHIAISRSGGTLKMFANGIQVYSAANTTNYDAVNSDTLKIGGNWLIGGSVVTWVNGYLSNTRIVKGTGLYTSSFTLPTTNLTAVSGTSLLTLQNATIVDNSTNAFIITNNNSVTTGLTYPFSAAKIFKDQGPAGNNWTPNNISGAFGSTLDYMTDVPTLTSATVSNYAVMNPLDKRSIATVTSGNLNTTSDTSGSWAQVRGTMAMTTGKWYWEVTLSTVNTEDLSAGIGNETTSLNLNFAPGSWANVYVIIDNGDLYFNNSSTTGYGTAFSNGDVIMVAFDRDNSKIYFGRNGTWFNSSNPATQTNPAASSISTSLTFFPMTGSAGFTPPTGQHNFGQRPFAYTPPSGFVALNTFNL